MEKIKGLEKLKKAELVDIILRKDDVDKAKNARLDELGTKLSASEKLIEELRSKSDKFKNEKDGINRRLSEANTTINSLKRDRDSLIGKTIKQQALIEELESKLANIKDKGKLNKAFGVIGCILIAVSVILMLIM